MKNNNKIYSNPKQEVLPSININRKAEMQESNSVIPVPLKYQFGGKRMSDLNGKIAIVTGANSGMGFATVEALSDMGATVLMLCRNEKRGKTAITSLTAEKERKLDLIICDLGD